MGWPKGRRSGFRKSGSKLGNEEKIVDGIKFHSKREARRYRDVLKVMLAAGEIEKLELQPKFPLEINGKPVKIRSKGYPSGRKSSYRADFRYRVVETGEVVVEDVKGFDTDYARLKRAIVECIYGIEIVLT